MLPALSWHDFFTWDGWTATGGLAQIGAAVVAIVAIWQGQKLLKHAERDRRESALPVLLPSGSPTIENIGAGDNSPGGMRTATKLAIRLFFFNNGFAAAAIDRVWFDPPALGDTYYYAQSHQTPTQKLVVTEGLLNVDFRCEFDQPFHSTMRLQYRTRLGESIVQAFDVRVERDGDGQPVCEVTGVPEARRPRLFRRGAAIS